jgi:hypothetical protein
MAENICEKTGKIIYDNKFMANHAANIFNQQQTVYTRGRHRIAHLTKRRGVQYAYKCRHCKKYHLTHKR